MLRGKLKFLFLEKKRDGNNSAYCTPGAVLETLCTYWSVNRHNPRTGVSLSCPFYRERNWGTAKINNLPTVTLLIFTEPGFESRHSAPCSHCHTTSLRLVISLYFKWGRRQPGKWRMEEIGTFCPSWGFGLFQSTILLRLHYPGLNLYYCVHMCWRRVPLWEEGPSKAERFFPVWTYRVSGKWMATTRPSGGPDEAGTMLRIKEVVKEAFATTFFIFELIGSIENNSFIWEFDWKG